MSDWSPGTIVDRYRIEGEIGGGSMGDVYRGHDVDLDRPVALKILSERHHDNDELRARFVREGRAVAKIAHPNVVQVFATGTYDDRPYIAMEFLRGVDLGSAVKDHGPWDSLQAARAVLDAAQGLEAAAAAGLIHRDVKPSNLVLLESGVVKVTDFGLAKPLDPSKEPALTALGVVVGTPDYIAPEQARGDAIDERVDIYALGGTIYYLLTGSPPFRTGTPAEDKYLKVVARHLKSPAPSARAAVPDADSELSALARRMMAKKREDRPGYPELTAALTAIVDRLAAGGDAAPVPVSEPDGRSGKVAPTPYVGGDTRLPEELAGPGPDAADTAEEPASAGPEARSGGEEPEEAAATLVRPAAEGGAAASRGSESLPIRGARGSRLLAGFTVLSVLLFLTGLLLTLAR